MKPVVIIAIAFVLLIPLPVFAPSHPEYVGFDTPRKQVAQGIEPVAVKCNEGLSLIIRHNGFPACVRPDTVESLEERGWGVIPPPCCKNMHQEPDVDREIIVIPSSKTFSSDQYILHGKIVTMNSENDQFIGNVLIDKNKILDVWQENQEHNTSINLNNIGIIETSGIIFPGLINLHNHMYYSTLPIWEVKQGYEDRYQWKNGKFYQTEISWPKKILTDSKFENLQVEVVKYAEIKALVGGTTSIVGAAADKRYGEILIRNAEYENFGSKKINTTVFRIDDIDEDDIKSRFNAGTLNTWLIHLAEGIDEDSKKEFKKLTSKDLLRTETVIVHGTALEKTHFEQMNVNKLDLVWSPLSNLLLYGKTTDVVTASNNDVRISLSTDWSPSGTKNLLDELKVADQLNKKQFENHFSDYDLVEMVTKNPAHTLKWENFVGTISPDKHADLLVIADSNEDPYRALINSIDSDVLLVIVDGDPLYGETEWMELLKPGDYEEIKCNNMIKAIDTTKEGIVMGEQKWFEIENNLSTAMNSLEDYKNDYSGIHNMQLTPLFASCDQEYFSAIENSVNIGFELDLWNEYYN